MKTSTIAMSLLVAVAAARSLSTQPQKRAVHRTFMKREVPQEHSHESFLTAVGTALNLNNPNKFGDPVFGLLGAAAAIKGAGTLTDADCLQQAIADQAFTNSKAAKDVNGMTAALVYRTLERNTGAVGLKSVPCNSIKAVNPEIAALEQHQDPASNGAAAKNKAITLELATQIAAVGGDPEVALQSGTFAPGKIGDDTAKGNTCDDLDDPKGCIFTQNLLVEDATAAEIAAVVAAAGAGAGAGAAVDAAAGADAAVGAGDADAAVAVGGADAAAAPGDAADIEELLQEVVIDATTSIKIIKVTKAGAAGADAAATVGAGAAGVIDAAAGAGNATDAAGAVNGDSQNTKKKEKKGKKGSGRNN